MAKELKRAFALGEDGMRWPTHRISYQLGKVIGYNESIRVFALASLREFWEREDASAELALRGWYRQAASPTWSNFSDVKQTFPQTDIVKDRYIFDVGGNKWRIMAIVNFEFGGVLVRWIGKHEAYSRLKERDIASL